MASRKGCCVAALVYEHMMEGDISRPQIFHKKTKTVSIRCMVYSALIFEVPSNRNLCSTWLRSHYGRYVFLPDIGLFEC